MTHTQVALTSHMPPFFFRTESINQNIHPTNQTIYKQRLQNGMYQLLSLLLGATSADLPGYAGNLYTTIAYLPNRKTHRYWSFGILFNARGTSMSVRGAPPYLSYNQYAAMHGNWDNFTTTIFDNHPVQTMPDNSLIVYGYPQNAPSHSKSLCSLGYDNIGLILSQDYLTLSFVSGQDCLTNKASRASLEFMFPDNFFKCSGDTDLIWHKLPEYMMKDGANPTHPMRLKRTHYTPPKSIGIGTNAQGGAPSPPPNCVSMSTFPTCIPNNH